MWKKAGELKAITNSTVRDHLSDNCWIVASKSKFKPNCVSRGHGGKFTYDCIGNKEMTVCSHTLAVADSEGCLAQLTG